MKPSSPLFKGKGTVIKLNQYLSESVILSYIFISPFVTVHVLLWLRFTRFVQVGIQTGYCLIEHKSIAITWLWRTWFVFIYLFILPFFVFTVSLLFYLLSPISPTSSLFPTHPSPISNPLPKSTDFSANAFTCLGRMTCQDILSFPRLTNKGYYLYIANNSNVLTS